MRLLLLLPLFMILSCNNSTTPRQAPTNENPDQQLAAMLDTIWKTEQNPIRERDSIGKVHGFESPEFNAKNEIYHKNHLINEKKIIHLLATKGWPSKAIIGEQGNLTICNVLQHSDYTIRTKYIPMTKEAVKTNNLHPRLLTRAEDRIATDLGKPQIYGGQIKYYPATQSFDVWPIIDPANVDKRRAAIGLEPIAKFLKEIRTPLEWDLEKQIKRTEEFLSATSDH